MRAVLFGSVQFSGKCLSRFLRGWPGLELVGVVTKERSSLHADFLSLEPMARQFHIPVRFSMGHSSEDEELANWLRARSPDLIFVLGWSHLLSKEVMSCAKLGCVGFHPSMLPKNRGRHPLVWTLALGLKEAGSTFFWLGSGADDGDIISQRAIPVTETDDAATLYAKVESVALSQLDDFVPALVGGERLGTPQNPSLANEWRKRSKKDGEIDWRMSADSIRNLVRALAKPYPGATARRGEASFPVWRVEISKLGEPEDEPGKVLQHKEGGDFVVKCGVGSLHVIHHEISPLPKEGEYL